ncbi:MAG: inositol monophosphatase family protein [Candidatus Diapherotrites archaeon]
MGRKELGHKLAKDAGKLLLKYFRKDNVEKEKGRRDLVLGADYKVEELIMNSIKKEFPDDTIVSEESDGRKGTSGHKWIIDPLDGTVNFSSGIPHFNVSIGVEKENEMRYAFVYNPVTDELFSAEKNKGAFLNGEKIKVSSEENLEKFLVAYGASNHKDAEMIELGVDSVRKILLNCRAIRMRGSAMLDFCHLANGMFDGYIRIDSKEWETPAGILLIEEAGGRVTDFDGKEWGPKAKNLLASNGKKHKELVEIMKNS